jgi:hypothetical protein
LRRANTPWPATDGDHFLEAADFGRGGGDNLDAPALLLGVALVHAQEVAREERRFVAAGAGADFEHGGALVGGVAGEELEGELALGLGELLADLGHLLVGQGPHVGVALEAHLLERGEFGAQAADLARGLGDRLDLGIILGELHEVLRVEVARRHRRLQLLPPRLDLRDPFRGDGGHSASFGRSIASGLKSTAPHEHAHGK